MTFPFSMACGCCPECRACPCAAGSAASSLQVIFEEWSSAPAGYCHSCDELNTTLEVPSVAAFSSSGEIGDSYQLTSPKAPCIDGGVIAGAGCRFEVTEEFDCVPQVCLDVCISGCESGCTEDEDCTPEGCGDYSCGSDAACFFYGGSCALECAQPMTCVFDEELDPEHLAGSCAAVGDCEMSVAANSCVPIRLRVRIVFYVTSDLRPAVSAQVMLFSRTSLGIAVATALYGFHEFEEDELDCAAFDFELPLSPIDGYTQPPVPACGAPTSVRILGLP